MAVHARTATLALLAAAPILIVPASQEALAQDAGIDVRAANQLEVYYDTELKESLLDDRLDVDLSYKMFSAGVVFLSHTPSDPLRLDPNDYGAQQQGVRKRWVTGQRGPLELRLGDSYATFGNGLVLRIFEDQAVDFDNAVDGVHGTASLGSFTIEAIAGTNSFGEEETNVAGVSGSFTAGGWLMSLNGARVDSVAGKATRPGKDWLGSVQASGNLLGRFDLAGEYAIRRHGFDDPAKRDLPEGHGAYASFHTSAGPVSLLLEGKDLLRFDHPYTTPPTAVRQHTSTLLNRGSHVPNIRLDDERGYQIEGLVTPDEVWTLTGNYSRSEARHADLPAWEAFGQAEAAYPATHLLAYGAEAEETIREGEDRVFFERITFGGDVLQSITDLWSFEVGYETQGIQERDYSNDDYTFPRKYRDHLVSLTVSRAPIHSWAATIEYTVDNPRETKDTWVWLEWNIRLGTFGQLTVAGGSLRGGQVCSGGVCKIVDPFEGGRLEMLTYF
ncbi:MAG: DUF6029 family protein [Candidatus Eisenbacteria bacterium]